VFRYAPGRGKEHAGALLAGYRGILQCDGYAAYKGVSASGGDGVTLAFCRVGGDVAAPALTDPDVQISRVRFFMGELRSGRCTGA
jgi:hypothetical protein